MIHDAAVYTLNPQQPWAEAVAVRDGIIVAVGNADDMATLTRTRREAALRGRTGNHHLYFEKAQAKVGVS